MKIRDQAWYNDIRQEEVAFTHCMVAKTTPILCKLISATQEMAVTLTRAQTRCPLPSYHIMSLSCLLFSYIRMILQAGEVSF